MKKVLIGAAGIAMAFSLAACGSKTVATTSGGKVTQEQFYDNMKKTSSGKQVLQEMIVNKVLEKEYGKQVSQKTVDKQYNAYKEQYGSALQAQLQQNGMTSSSLKKQIRSNLLLKAAIKDNDAISNSDLEKAWKDYQPKVTVAQITTEKEDDAKKAIDDLKGGKDFKDVAKKYSIDPSKDNGGKIAPFDNTEKNLDPAFKDAAFKLDEGKFTESPVKTDNGYVVIKMINKPNKGKLADHKSAVKEQIWNSDMSNPEKLRSIITKVLKKGNVIIKDPDLKNALDDYLGSSSQSKK